VKGKGGVFKATVNCSGASGLPVSSTRPLRRRASSGAPIGMAARGLKPVAEIQFFDYIWPAMMQLRERTARNSVAFDARSSPAVIRVGDWRLPHRGGLYHSQI